VLFLLLFALRISDKQHTHIMARCSIMLREPGCVCSIVRMRMYAGDAMLGLVVIGVAEAMCGRGLTGPSVL